jgi:hypothetical protein
MNAMKKGIMYRRGAFDEVCTQCNGGKVIDEPTDLPEWAINRISDHYKDIEDDKRTSMGRKWLSIIKKAILTDSFFLFCRKSHIGV